MSRHASARDLTIQADSCTARAADASRAAYLAAEQSVKSRNPRNSQAVVIALAGALKACDLARERLIAAQEAWIMAEFPTTREQRDGDA